MKKINQKIIVNCIIIALVAAAAAYCIWYAKYSQEAFAVMEAGSTSIQPVNEENLSTESANEEETEGFLAVEIGIGDTGQIEQKVSVYCDGTAVYAFMPAYAKEKELSFWFDEAEYQVSLQNKKQIVGEKADITFGEEYLLELTHFKEDGQEEKIEYPFSLVCSENIPAIFIQTESGGMDYVNSDKENQESGMLICIDSNGNVEYDGELEKISGRGNSSWEEDKKSYGITLAVESNLAGIEKADKWILQANVLDASRMRNKITYDIAKEIGLDYAVDSEYVDVYFNGEYAGNYLLCERIEVGENRVDITDLEKVNEENQSNAPEDYRYIETENGSYYALEKEPDDVTGGYLLEFNDRLTDTEMRDESFFYTQDKTIEVKNPKYLSEEEYNYISGFVAKVDESLQLAAESEDYRNYIDENSWALVFLLNELSNNTDANRYSVFYYKDRDSVNSKLCAGPVWDYDIAWGNDYDGYDYTCSFFRLGWYNRLYDNEEFHAKVVENYKTKMQPVLQRYVETEIDAMAETISASICMDEIRWQNSTGYEKRSPYHEYTDAINYLKWYMQNRNDFYTEVWLSGEEYHRVFFQNGDMTEALTYVKNGESLKPELVDYMTDALYVDGWKYDNGNDYVAELPVLNDTVLYAKQVENTTEVVDNAVEVVDNNNGDWHRLLPVAALVVTVVILWNLYLLISFVHIKKTMKKGNNRQE